MINFLSITLYIGVSPHYSSLTKTKDLLWYAVLPHRKEDQRNKRDKGRPKLKGIDEFMQMASHVISCLYCRP